MQGIVFRKGDTRFEGLSAEDAVRAALADADCMMVNRNQGAGTRILIDRLLGGARPDGYWNQPRSHNAVAAAVAQDRADWGMTIAPVAHASDLGFIPFAEEHYDFALVKARKQRPAVQAFLDALASEEARAALEKAGFAPARCTCEGCQRRSVFRPQREASGDCSFAASRMSSSSAASRSASAISSMVLALKNGSSGVVGHVTVASR